MLTTDITCSPQAMYESTINLIYALTSIAAVSSVNSGKGEYVDALVRARIFWSGILHDWMVNGLRGGRMFLWVLLLSHSLRSLTNSAFRPFLFPS